MPKRNVLLNIVFHDTHFAIGDRKTTLKKSYRRTVNFIVYKFHCRPLAR